MSTHESRWTIIADDPAATGHRRVIARCACGTERSVTLATIRNGASKSCGCLSRQVAAERQLKHGMRQIPEYQVWLSMRQRCGNPNDKGYGLYGGRGIRVCERWNSFAAFINDMGRRPSDGHSIDRIDVNGNYAPDNCRWATTQEQRANVRPRTHCRKGHEYTSENTLPPGSSYRCRICRRDARRRRTQSKAGQPRCDWGQCDREPVAGSFCDFHADEYERVQREKNT